MSGIKNEYFDEITSDLASFDIARADAAWHDAYNSYEDERPVPARRVDILAALESYSSQREFRGYLRLTLIKLLLDDAAHDKIDDAAKNYLRELKNDGNY